MKEYAVIYEQGPKNWSAYVPDLPECIATGKTLEETQATIKEAIVFHLEGMVIDGEPIPEPTTKAATVAVDEPVAA